MCGIIGVQNAEKSASADLFLGLLNLQHRGKESARIVTRYNNKFYNAGGMGEVSRALDAQSLMNLPGSMGIGHTRYSNAGESSSGNEQPLQGIFRGHEFFVCHNGNIVNISFLRREANLPERHGVSDTHTIVRLLEVSSKRLFEDALLSVVRKLGGAFNLLILFGDTMYAVKDRFGFHPLVIGGGNGGIVIASESCALNHLGARIVRDVAPGEIITVKNNTWKAEQWTYQTMFKFDIFECIYFMRPDSIAHGIEAGGVRYKTGWLLAKRHNVNADIIVSIADSGNEAALGYYEGRLAQGDDILFRPWALFRPHTTGRTFIEPLQELRDERVGQKFNPRRSQLAGKRVVLVDDSIVRGTTMRKNVQMVRGAGAISVSAVISSAPYLYPDFYGIDTYRKKNELIARRYEGDIERIREACGLDHLWYLPHKDVITSVLSVREPNSPLSRCSFYDGPFTGIYPAGCGDFAAL